MAAFDVALRAIDKFVGAVGLVVVELQGLRHAGVGDVKIHIVFEMGSAIGRAKLLPPESVRVRCGSADAELHGLSIQRRGRLVLHHGVGSYRTVGIGASADSATFPASHLVNIALDYSVGGGSRQG